MERAYRMVDVFGRAAFTGNPVAVIADGDGLDTATMQRITRWLNLSETTFLCRPTDPAADYRVRIFTLERELPFAGHPTLGTCHAWLEAGGRPRRPDRIVQQCGVGLVEVRREDAGQLAFAAPALLRGGPLDEATLLDMLAFAGVDRARLVDAAWVDNGPGWCALLLDSAAAVLAARPARSSPQRIELGLVGPHPADSDVDFEVRALFSDAHGGILEDPVTGSLNASIAQWLFATGHAADAYVAAQGTCLGREGRIGLRQIGGVTWVAGATRTLMTGQLQGFA